MEPEELDSDRVLRALSIGVEEAKRAHKQAGRPIAIWKDGRVVIVPPEEIELAVPAPEQPAQ